MEKRVISTQVQDEDIKIEKNLRPQISVSRNITMQLR